MQIRSRQMKMDEQTRIDLATMQLLFAKCADRLDEKGFKNDADMFMQSCNRLTEIIEKNFSE